MRAVWAGEYIIKAFHKKWHLASQMYKNINAVRICSESRQAFWAM